MPYSVRPRRALLYMPGDDRRKIDKAASLDVDCICMDLEDGVALSNKPAARETVVAALAEVDFGRAERLVRINPAETELAVLDLAFVLPAGPDGILIPKVETAEHVRWVSSLVAAQSGAPGPALIAVVETARGVVNLKEIAGADPRLAALALGAEDLASSMGATRTPAGWEMLYARSALVTHAAAFGLQALDMIYVDFRDSEGLEQEAVAAARMGFEGKQAIHPNQLEPIQRAFTPCPDEIARARRLVDAFAEHSARGTGAFALDGKMIDAPLLKAAQKLLARARHVDP